jgi:membrane protein DedA with SNARE-associated domain
VARVLGNMAAMLESLLDLVTASTWTYAILFGLAAADAVFPVVPSEASVIAAGVLAATDRLDVGLVIAAAAAGAWVGDNTSYVAGRRIGRPIARRFFTRPKALRRLEWARGQLDERGAYLVVIARFIPGGRTATTFTAGLVHYRWLARFGPLTVLAAVIWATYATLVGYLGGRVFVERPVYGLVLAFALAAAVAVAIEVSRRVRHG